MESRNRASSVSENEKNERQARIFVYKKNSFWNKLFKPKQYTYFDESKCLYQLSDVYSYIVGNLNHAGNSAKNLKQVLNILSTKDNEFGDTLFILVARWDNQNKDELLYEIMFYPLLRKFLFDPHSYKSEIAIQFFNMLSMKNENDETFCTLLAKNYVKTHENKKIIQSFCSALIQTLLYSGGNVEPKVDDISGIDVKNLLSQKDRDGYSLFDLKEQPDIKESMDILMERCDISNRRNEKYASAFSSYRAKQ